MYPTRKTNWEQNCLYNRSCKLRFDEINNTIGCLLSELQMNDIVLKNELDVRINSEYDRALMSAELYKERLEALANSSRSQIWRVQTGNSPLTSHVFDLDYDSWNPKRTKYTYGQDYSQNWDWDCNSNKTQPIKRAVPSKHTNRRARASAKRTATTSKPLEKNGTTFKKIASAKGVAAVRAQASVTATKRVAASTTSTACENATSVKTGPNIDKNELTQNIPSLLSCDLSHIKLEYDEANNIFGKYKKNLTAPLKNLAIKIKAEPVIDEDAMVDDLADRL